MKQQRARGITKDGKPIFDEDYEHILVADWLRAHNIFFIHVPNSGKRSPAYGKKMKRMGMLAGVSDFLIFDPPPLVLATRGAVLELKALDGKPPSKEQITFLGSMQRRGYEDYWCRGAEAAIKWLSEYCGYGRRK